MPIISRVIWEKLVKVAAAKSDLVGVREVMGKVTEIQVILVLIIYDHPLDDLPQGSSSSSSFLAA
jgi:hypothetical protein